MRLLLTFAFIVTMGASISAFAQSSHGVFKVVKGDVTVTAKDGKTTKAKIGMKVQPGEKIKAGPDSRAKIVMVDNNELNVSPDSEIVIEQYNYKPDQNDKNVLINVIYGKMRAKVNQKYDGDTNKFQVKTRSAVAGVRGTDFFTSYQPTTNETRVVTFEGQVAFGLPGPNGTIRNAVLVGVGQTTSVTGNTPPPPPVEVPKSEMSSLDSASNAESAKGPEPREPNSSAAPQQEPAQPQESPRAATPREPASTSPGGVSAPGLSPGSMIRNEDIPSAGGVVTPVVASPLPPTFTPPTPVVQPPTCTICNQIIEGQQTTLKVIIDGP